MKDRRLQRIREALRYKDEQQIPHTVRKGSPGRRHRDELRMGHPACSIGKHWLTESICWRERGEGAGSGKSGCGQEEDLRGADFPAGFKFWRGQKTSRRLLGSSETA